jgi:hypothetical protein
MPRVRYIGLRSSQGADENRTTIAVDQALALAVDAMIQSTVEAERPDENEKYRQRRSFTIERRNGTKSEPLNTLFIA